MGASAQPTVAVRLKPDTTWNVSGVAGAEWTPRVCAVSG
jgi:hypothetical protein